MSYIISDGAGSTTKVNVFENHVRAFANEVSLMNHLTTEVNGRNVPPEEKPNVGVFTIRNSGSVGASSVAPVLSLQNNDPINFLLIDRIYIQTFSSGLLPTPNTFIALRAGGNNASVSNPVFQVINENLSVINNPIVNSLQILTQNFFELYRVFPTNGDGIEMLPQGLDSIILEGAPPFGSSSPLSATISSFIYLEIDNSASSDTINFNACMRFAIAHRGDIEVD